MTIVSDHRFPIVGHAIVSADGMIADATGNMPEGLRNDADFALFQAALDRASVVVVGSLGHRRHPNPGRRRLVFTSTVQGLQLDAADPLASFYNPADLPLADALDRLGLPDGVVAVTGGRRVFDHLSGRFDAFDLAEVNGLVLPDGVPCFSAGHPRQVLAAQGLVPGTPLTIDAANHVTLTRWARPERG